MPTNKAAFPLKAEYIERDEGIALSFPGIEPVQVDDVLDRNLLNSAAVQPFQGGFGVDFFYPTIYDKAACLFFSVAGGHIFGNGNKRTAVLTLDQFTAANSIYLLLPNEDIYELALNTATYKTRNENSSDVIAKISKLIETNSVPFAQLKKRNKSLWGIMVRLRMIIRTSNGEKKRKRKKEQSNPQQHAIKTLPPSLKLSAGCNSSGKLPAAVHAPQEMTFHDDSQKIPHRLVCATAFGHSGILPGRFDAEQQFGPDHNRHYEGQKTEDKVRFNRRRRSEKGR